MMGKGPKPVKVHEKAMHEKAKHGIATIPTGCLFIGPHLLLTVSSWGIDSSPPVLHQRQATRDALIKSEKRRIALLPFCF